MNDLFDPKNEVENKVVNWSQVGDYVAGTLVSIEEKEVLNQNTKKTEMRKLYEIKATEGSWHNLDDNKKVIPEPQKASAGDYCIVWGRAVIDQQLKNVKVGQIIGLKFKEEIPSKTKGNNPLKIIKLYTEGKIDPEFMAGIGQENQFGSFDDQ